MIKLDPRAAEGDPWCRLTSDPQHRGDANLDLELGVQHEPPQDMPLWGVDHFKLKATETLRAQEKRLSPLPLNYVEEFKLGAQPTMRTPPEVPFYPPRKQGGRIVTGRALFLQ